MTEKLFYKDSYLKSFNAKVISCDACGEGYSVILDQTAFYPEGGGQPSDIGSINNVQVLYAKEKNGEIIHTTSDKLEAGETVVGMIDWEHRFSLMQQHSGEHIVSGLVQKHLGLDNVGFHIGSEAVTLDFNGELTKEVLTQIETEANAAIYANIPVVIGYPSQAELSTLVYRSKKELTGDVRIVTVPGCDVCACCGTHTQSTGEVGIIKILSSQSYKGGTRVSILCGSRALNDYREKNKSAYDISAMLSVKTGEVSAGVEKTLSDMAVLKQRYAALQTQLFKVKAAALCGIEDAFIFEDEATPNDLRQFCALLCKQSKQAIVLSGTDEAGYKYALGSEMLDVRPLGKELNTAFNGRGGGAKELCQGAVLAKKQEIEAFLLDSGFKSTL